MKYCEKCGKEIMEEAVVCPGCGCAVKKSNDTAQMYTDAVEKAAKSSTTFLALGIVFMLLGVVVALFVNVWIGAVLLLVSEFLCLMPKSKINSIVKRNNSSLSKKELVAKCKQEVKNMKSKYTALKICMPVAVISLVLMIIFFMLGSAMGL